MDNEILTPIDFIKKWLPKYEDKYKEFSDAWQKDKPFTMEDDQKWHDSVFFEALVEYAELQRKMCKLAFWTCDTVISRNAHNYRDKVSDIIFKTPMPY